MFSRKYRKRIEELETQLENTEKELKSYKSDCDYLTKENIRLVRETKQLRKELHDFPARNKKGQFEKRKTKQKPVTA